MKAGNFSRNERKLSMSASTAPGFYRDIEGNMVHTMLVAGVGTSLHEGFLV